MYIYVNNVFIKEYIDVKIYSINNYKIEKHFILKNLYLYDKGDCYLLNSICGYFIRISSYIISPLSY